MPPCHSLLCAFVSPRCFQWEVFTDRFFGGLGGLKPSHEHCALCHIPLRTPTLHCCKALTKSITAAFAAERPILCSAAPWISATFYATLMKASWDLKLALLISPQHKMYTFITDLTSVWTSMALHHECCF